jgi:hypothetical protein
MPNRTTPGVDSFSRLIERWHLEQRTISKFMEVGPEPVVEGEVTGSVPLEG